MFLTVKRIKYNLRVKPINSLDTYISYIDNEGYQYVIIKLLNVEPEYFMNVLEDFMPQWVHEIESYSATLDLDSRFTYTCRNPDKTPVLDVMDARHGSNMEQRVLEFMGW